MIARMFHATVLMSDHFRANPVDLSPAFGSQWAHASSRAKYTNLQPPHRQVSSGELLVFLAYEDAIPLQRSYHSQCHLRYFLIVSRFKPNALNAVPGENEVNPWAYLQLIVLLILSYDFLFCGCSWQPEPH
jgi:hypothetical protein